jgi:hypothetical protein
MTEQLRPEQNPQLNADQLDVVLAMIGPRPEGYKRDSTWLRLYTKAKVIVEYALPSKHLPVELTENERDAAAAGDPNVKQWVFARITDEMGWSELRGLESADGTTARHVAADLAIQRTLAEMAMAKQTDDAVAS